MFSQLKAIIAGVTLLAAIAVAGMIYWRGSHNAATKADLRVARETIKAEREALKITHTIDMRVNAEGIQTAKTAQEAASEIEALRTTAAVRTSPQLAGGDAGRGRLVESAGCDDSCARVLQLAREARAAALASGARLQSEGTGAR